MIISPLKAFLVDYKINNPSDTAQHWVRAVIKNSISGAVIATLNLVDNGSGYFSKSWITPVDSSGSGLQILILRTVYDDAGYTTESLAYGTTLETHIIQDLSGAKVGFGSGVSSAKTDYKEIEKIVRKIVGEIPQVKVSHDEVLNKMEEVKESLADVIGSSDKSEEIKAEISRVMETLADRVLGSSEFKSLHSVNSLPDRFKNTETSHDELHSFVEQQTAELKEFVYNAVKGLVQKVDSALAQPVTIEIQQPNAKAERKQPEVVSPRRETLEKLMEHAY